MKRILLITMGLISVWSCSNPNANKQIPLPEVTAVPVVQSDLPIYAEYVGQAYGLSDVKVQARVEGLITGIHFKEGLPVKEGDLLYTIDDMPYQAKVSEAEGKVADAETEQARSKSDLDRVIPLAATNALSQRDLDAAKAAYQAAQARVKAARAALENARIQLSYASVIAPISGTIGISTVRVGDFVGGMSSRNLNTISAINQMRVRFPISENDYLTFVERYKKDSTYKPMNQEVDLILSNGNLYPYKGKFNIANREIDPATGSLLLEVIVDNPNGVLRPGQYMRVRFVAESVKNALIVPQRAVLQTQNIYQVYVLGDSNKVEAVMVKPGLRSGENWVIESGLKPGDQVLLLGNKMIRPGTKVQPLIQGDSTKVTTP
ncbi:MAG: efflux RND transporter periplasmic adaptor subunit [Bacteroidia bacterium]|jgi:membrane fusion protein (multidrug efflux system)|nr:efflux RND transporter periplasmic adaptor subunit [Bacteroidia bacterium]